MISKEQLESIGFSTEDNTLYYDAPNWDFEYNIKTQELFSFNDGYGEPEFLCRVTDINQLEIILDTHKP